MLMGVGGVKTGDPAGIRAGSSNMCVSRLPDGGPAFYFLSCTLDFSFTIFCSSLSIIMSMPAVRSKSIS